MPKLKKRYEKIATMIVGITAIRLNSTTSRICSREPARPRRRSAQTSMSRHATTAPSSSSSTRSRLSSDRTAFGSGPKGGVSVSERYVAIPDARPAVASTIAMLRRSPIRPAQLRSRRIGFMRNSAGGSASYGSDDIKPNCLRPIPRSHPSVTRASRLCLCGRGGLGVVDASASFYAADDRDVQLTDLFAQGVAIETEQVGGPNLIAAGGAEGLHDQWPLDLAQYPIV